MYSIPSMERKAVVFRYKKGYTDLQGVPVTKPFTHSKDQGIVDRCR